MQKIASFGVAWELKYPEQVVLVITKNAEGRVNLMAIGWVCICSDEPPMFLIGIDDHAYTLELIRESREFVIAYPSGAMAKETLYVGTTHGHHEDKGTQSDLQFAQATQVNVPLLADAVANFECRLLDIITKDSNINFKDNFNNLPQNGNFCLVIGIIIASHVNKDKTVCHITNTMKESLLNIYMRQKDNKNIKKNQHYVWQKYLSPWKEDDKHIWCFDKKSDISYRTTTKSTAYEKLFYKIPELNNLEFNCIKKFIDKNPSPLIREEMNLFLSISQETIGLLNDFSSSNTFPNAKKLVEKTIANLEENYLANIENNFMKYLDSCYKLDLSFTAEYDSRWNFALCVFCQ